MRPVFSIILSIALLCPPLLMMSQFSTSRLPLVIIDSIEDTIPDEPKVEAWLKIISNPDGSIKSIWSEPDVYDGHIGIERRGSSSLMYYPKNQFGFETRLQDGSNNNVELLGMPSENDWILHTSFFERSLIRNVFANELFRAAGHYAPRMRACEVWVDGSYEGVYHLTEKIKRDDDRLDLAEYQSSTDIDGGFILKLDRPRPGCDNWASLIGESFVSMVYPDCDDISMTQQTFIQERFQELEASALELDFVDLRERYDMSSAIDYFLHTELSKNVDGYRLSTYVHYKGGETGRFYFGPTWDYDRGYGLVANEEVHLIQGIRAVDQVHQTIWPLFLQDSIFYSTAQLRWAELRGDEGVWSDEAIVGLIDSLAAQTTLAAQQNFTRWNILKVTLPPNVMDGLDYEEEIEYLKSWVLARAAWMDGYFKVEESKYLAPEDVFIVYPNPISHFVQFEFRLDEASEIRYELIDELGRILHQEVLGSFEPGIHREFLDVDPSFDFNSRHLVMALYQDGVRLGVQRLMRKGSG